METKTITVLPAMTALLFAVNAKAAAQRAIIPWGTATPPTPRKFRRQPLSKPSRLPSFTATPMLPRAASRVATGRPAVSASAPRTCHQSGGGWRV
jgi:hypothetical protein